MSERLGMMAGMMEECTRLTPGEIGRDAQGGLIQPYLDGAAFRALFIKNASPQAQEAERQVLGELYTIVTEKGTGLGWQDVFRRESDGTTFRVTSNHTDAKAPEISTVLIEKVTAERWEIPS